MVTVWLRRAAIAIALLMLVATGLLAHGGGLDAQGGHHNRKAGGYHFHMGSLTGRSFASKAEATEALAASSSTEETPESPSVEAQLTALTNILIRKGVITKAELDAELDRIK